MPEKRGSMPSVKVSRISFGDAGTVPPTSGAAWSRKACALRRRMMPTAVATRLQKKTRNSQYTEQWSTDSLGKDVVQIEVQLGDDADILSGWLLLRG